MRNEAAASLLGPVTSAPSRVVDDVFFDVDFSAVDVQAHCCLLRDLQECCASNRASLV